MTSLRFLSALLVAPLLALPAGAYPRPVGVAPYGRAPNPWAYGDTYSDGRDVPLPPPPVTRAPYGTTPYSAQPLSLEQLAQRCNTGRLVGGLMGGGLGYALSRQDGRAWAIPLGALLGSQVGCSTAAGRGAVPW
jgi:outer membrane lipoprotein SlyB